MVDDVVLFADAVSVVAVLVVVCSLLLLHPPAHLDRHDCPITLSLKCRR